jgi:hypothetical protein
VNGDRISQQGGETVFSLSCYHESISIISQDEAVS